MKRKQEALKSKKNSVNKKGRQVDKDIPTHLMPADFQTAIRKGNLAAVKKFVTKGTDIQATFKQENSESGRLLPTIMYAADLGHSAIVDFLDGELKKKCESYLWGGQKAYDSNFKIEEGVTFLHAAVWGGNLQLVKRAIEVYKINPNCYFVKNFRNENGMTIGYAVTPIAIAAMEGKIEIVEYLLTHKASSQRLLIKINRLSMFSNKSFWEQVQLSTQVGSQYAAHERQRGAQIMSIYSLAPLHEAVRYGHEDVVNYLLKAGVPIGSYDHKGYTPIIAASESVDEATCIKMAKFLLGKGAAIDRSGEGWRERYNNQRQEFNITPLYASIRQRYIELTRCLLEYSPSLNVSCSSERIDGSNQPLLQYDPRWNIQRTDRMNAVELALTILQESKGASLLELIFSEAGDGKPDLSIDESKFTEEELNRFYKCTDKLQLFRYARIGSERSLENLLDNSDRTVYANIESVDDQENTALHVAASKSQVDVARFLLRKYANPNAVDKYNKTPLDKAISSKCTVEMVRLLLPLTDIQIEGALGNVLQTAMLFKTDIKIIKLLLNKAKEIGLEYTSSSSHTPIVITAVQHRRKDVLDVLHEQDASLTGCDDNGYNALMACSYSTLNTLYRYLINEGVPVDAKKSDGQTVYSIAHGSQHIDLCIAILAARLLFLIASGQIPYEDKETCDDLFNLGGSVNQRDSQQRTLLHVAWGCKNTQFAEYLLLEQDANAEAEDENGRRAEEIEDDEEYNNIEYDISDITCRTNDFLKIATEQGKSAEAKKLLNLIDIALRQENGPDDVNVNNTPKMVNKKSGSEPQKEPKGKKKRAAAPPADLEDCVSQTMFAPPKKGKRTAKVPEPKNATPTKQH